MNPQCPKCAAFKTYNVRNRTFLVGGIVALFGVLFSWLIIPIFVFFPFAVFCIMGGLTLEKSLFQCEICKHKFNI